MGVRAWASLAGGAPGALWAPLAAGVGLSGGKALLILLKLGKLLRVRVLRQAYANIRADASRFAGSNCDADRLLIHVSSDFRRSRCRDRFLCTPIPATGLTNR